MKKCAAFLFVTAMFFLPGCQSALYAPAEQQVSEAYIRNILGVSREKHAQVEAPYLATLALLDKRISINNDNATLGSVIKHVQQTTGANFAINWPALALVDIDQDSIITINLTNVAAHDLLQLALEQASADAFDDDKAGFSIRRGIVVISTLRDLKSDTYTETYNVRWYLQRSDRMHAWLLEDQPDAAALLLLLYENDFIFEDQSKQRFDLNDALSSTSSGGSTRGGSDRKGGGGLFGHNEEEDEAKSYPYWEQRADVLYELIQTTTGDPDEWLDEKSTLTELNGKFIIKTTRENHVEIIDLLISIHKAHSQRYKRFARAVEVYKLLREAESYRFNQDYRRALKKIDEALRVDPNSPEARGLKTIMTETLSR